MFYQYNNHVCFIMFIIMTCCNCILIDHVYELLCANGMDTSDSCSLLCADCICDAQIEL